MPNAGDTHDGLHALAAAQRRVAGTLTAAMIALYFGFILPGAPVIVCSWLGTTGEP